MLKGPLGNSHGTVFSLFTVPLLSAAIKIFHTAAVINHWHLGNKGRADMEVPSVTGIPLLLVETESQANKHGFHGHLLVPLVNHMLVPLVISIV